MVYETINFYRKIEYKHKIKSLLLTVLSLIIDYKC